ncbi:hypothetical protein ENKNEFLB_00769 [Nocardioides aquaticus]|uniref:CopC domain-containing protein n=1 Tax=Nocardioides aquaticus TaxID=160826 RepID=A0ABX8EH49_9ACTN|nr:copper resistance protein CopC [Nocardioides aquaticus]QVT78392.1 hypothetical protein ENKNEFLB_00769 [Nocardioides aquaticus]
MTKRRCGATGVAALLLVLASGGAASAHGDLTGGSPGPGDETAPGVTTLRLDLLEVDGDAPLSVAVTDEAGDPVAVGEAQVVDSDYVCAAVEPLTDGVWTIDYAGTGVDGHRFGSRFAFEVLPGGEQADPGPCADAELAAPGEAQTLAEMTETDAGVPVWVVWTLVGLGLVSAAAVVLRVRRDRASDADPGRG